MEKSKQFRDPTSSFYQKRARLANVEEQIEQKRSAINTLMQENEKLGHGREESVRNYLALNHHNEIPSEQNTLRLSAG